ncbi:MAG: hypothetical protein HZB46_05720 [Solirubrobacterales bacterium]|nr:hypothetical protein [Solirubrobacterales bacterium]
MRTGMVLAAAGIAALAPGAAAKSPDHPVDVREPLRDAAARRPAPGPPAERRAREALARRLGDQGVVDVDPLTGTVRALGRLDGALTGPSDQSAVTVARRFARDHATAIGLGAADVRELAPETGPRSPGGVAIVRLRQQRDGIPAFDGVLDVALDRANRVVAVTGAPRDDLGAARRRSPAPRPPRWCCSAHARRGWPGTSSRTRPTRSSTPRPGRSCTARA